MNKHFTGSFKTGSMLLGVLILSALSGPQAVGKQLIGQGYFDDIETTIGTALGNNRPSDRDMIRPPIIPRIPPR